MTKRRRLPYSASAKIDAALMYLSLLEKTTDPLLNDVQLAEADRIRIGGKALKYIHKATMALKEIAIEQEP